MNDKRLFLLGGHDLEMVEIKKILEKHGEAYQDNNLSWGAKLSSYEDVLDFDGTIYGIELEEDTSLPDNYVSIDHHNENSDRNSSLKQIAKLLHVELTREQELISANDSRYIDGMKALCATQKEIDDIRAADRQAQGITQEDEEKARLSIEKSNSNTIYAYTPYFACISDLIYDKYDSYLIYDDTKLSFYGHELLAIKKFLHSFDITQESYYYGGGEFGFLGIKESVLTKEKIENLIKEFSRMQETDKTISHHIFMLPFKYTQKQNVITNWEISQETVSYNEQAYFHDFFIQSMYDNCELYERNEYRGKIFTVTTQEKKDKPSKTYELNVEKVLLRIFEDFNVGILSFHLDNSKNFETQAILEINDYARRIYPEYLDENFQCTLVPKSVRLDSINETFNYTQTDGFPKLSKIITDIVGENITPAVDDRMFTMCYFLNEKIADELKESYECHDKWYEYVFVDGDGKTVQSEEMQRHLIENATYERWRDYGSMYGMSRYSFVCLANSDFPLTHMKTMYFSMFSLLLMIRGTLLKFADDISKSAKEIDTKDISNDVSILYKDYIKFINKYYFREITAKDQGIELYEKAVETLKIQRDIKDLDNEIEELFKYVEMQNEKKINEENAKINKKLAKIEVWGGVLLGASVLTGFFGMNVGSEGNFSVWLVYPLLLIAISIGYFKFIKGES